MSCTCCFHFFKLLLLFDHQLKFICGDVLKKNYFDLCEKLVEVRRKSNRVVAVMLAFEEEVVRIICVYDPQSGRRSEVQRKSVFMMN